MWDDQDLAELTLACEETKNHSKESEQTCSPPNVCGGEDPKDKSGQKSSPPQEFGGTDHS